jgi:predicted HTH transcriptional regulator
MFSDKELLSRLRNTEDNFVERKTKADCKDWLKTAVAFANSVPIDYPAILFIGVKNNGDFEEGDCNFESLQRTFTKEVNKAYPPIYYLPKILREGNKECLAVIIPGSSNRPHFAGQAYIRVGPVTKEASDTEFSVLIADRNSKAYEIRKWVNKEVLLQRHGSGETERITLIDCNQFYVTYRRKSGLRSEPLRRLEISFNHNEEMLELRRV